MPPIRLAIVGMGKIAHDQHLPAIAGNPAFALAATVSRSAPGVAGVPHFETLAALLTSPVAVDAVVLATPPQPRHDLAALALAHGKHVFLEKPPAATLAEVAALEAQARQAGCTLFASWHARHAAGVEPARAWLAGQTIRSVAITWHEDVRVWHPGQQWIWAPGGLGVFDPGINALSIATHILPRPILLTAATLWVPSNRATPIAARLDCRDTAGVPISVDLDWRVTGPPRWDIEIETDGGPCTLSNGGAVLTLPNGSSSAGDSEYAGLYARFAELVAKGQSDVDVTPLRLVADAFLCGGFVTTAVFD